ncbi:MAG: sugar phosphate isomerase/epimerase [Candidatus Brocadiaceae bacterium]|nr:sugar phosphate isomerase/epimerase [Candidatus Brocadiaceae bacterium]
MKHLLGIMQGRVFPEMLDKLQIFPVSFWKEEMIKIKDIGFDYAELLYDKDLYFEKLFYDTYELNTFIHKEYNNVPMVRSICFDYLSSLSLIQRATEALFYEKLVKLIKRVRGSTVDRIIIPFFDANTVTSPESFQSVLAWMERYELDKIASENGVVLALEANLPAGDIRNAFMEHQFNNIKVCYDTGNARSMGYVPGEEIIVLNEFICHVHIKDRKVGGPNISLGEGDVDLKNCFLSLKEISYNDIMILETPYMNAPVSEARKNLRFIYTMLDEISL